MRLLYWIDDSLEALGHWAMRGPYRPWIVTIVSCVVMASSVTGMLTLMELVSGRK